MTTEFLTIIENTGEIDDHYVVKLNFTQKKDLQITFRLLINSPDHRKEQPCKLNGSWGPAGLLIVVTVGCITVCYWP